MTTTDMQPAECGNPQAMPLFEHEYSFDPSYGYDIDSLKSIMPPQGPSDFDMFWQDTWAENESLALGLELEEMSPFRPGWKMYLVRYTTLGGVRVGAWLEIPEEGDVEVGAVCGHGYGGREVPDFPNHHAAILHFCAPGFHLSAHPNIPNECYKHVLHGIEHRDTYIIRNCVSAVWSSARVIHEFLESAVPLYYFGGSLGGGLGALAMPYDDRFKKCALFVPTFGHQSMRLTLRSIGSGEPVRLYAQQLPEVEERLAYYDAGSAALRITMPNITAPALFDPSVPPPSQFAVSNPMSRHGHQFIYRAGHHEYPALKLEEGLLGHWIDEVIWEHS